MKNFPLKSCLLTNEESTKNITQREIFPNLNMCYFSHSPKTETALFSCEERPEQ